MNIAGVALRGTFEMVSGEDFDWLFNINFHGVVRMTRAFLPLLHASGDARLVNMSSTFGVTVFHPGGVRTNISVSARAPRGVDEAEVIRRRDAFQKFLRMPPAKTGEIIVRGIEQRKSRILVGTDAVGLSWLARLAPASYWSMRSRGLPT